MSSFTAGTYSARPSEVSKSWFVIDAENLTLGRMAAEVAKILRGKHKPIFTPYTDCGDHVIIINAAKVALTGDKKNQSIFYKHTGYPGGIKERPTQEILSGKFPERVVEKAVKRMMPKESPLARSQLKCLHVYAADSHLHEAQTPKALDLASKNKKNKRDK